ncbi:unnamed protein product [Periconia digitata]|uniref:Apple domain-containing protein n=1 Tax=Periconia digitata TaxID=1303443 RepID=A0A9W4UIR7_9PLEO|nr:unnamed protein product [Periconia digitata]
MKLSIAALSAAIVGFTVATPLPEDSGYVDTFVREEPIGYCIPLGEGYAPPPEEDTTFSSSPIYTNISKAALTPDTYIRTFSDESAAVFRPDHYLHRVELTSYSPLMCSFLCDTHDTACWAFNLYVERAPTKVPGPACPNPDPTYRYQCVLYDTPISKSDVENDGQKAAGFDVEVRGSNGQFFLSLFIFLLCCVGVVYCIFILLLVLCVVGILFYDFILMDVRPLVFAVLVLEEVLTWRICWACTVV